MYILCAIDKNAFSLQCHSVITFLCDIHSMEVWRHVFAGVVLTSEED